MAFASRNGPLVQELIEALSNSTSSKSHSQSFKDQYERALRSLRSHSYLRTNPFDVNSRIDGLEERFRINHREDLADALEERCHVLQQSPSKWHPEILSLLLELSDQPTFKSDLADLERLKQADGGEAESLRWEDIAREDGWAEDVALWASVRYTDSSADEEDEDEPDALTDESDETSMSGQDTTSVTVPDALMTHTEDPKLLESVQEAQSWRWEAQQKDPSGHQRKTAITEVQLIRESLFMLQGLPTTVFDSSCAAVPNFQLTGVKWDTHRAVINAFAEYGRQVKILRDFAEQPLGSPHVQVFQDCVVRRLEALDTVLSRIQNTLASPQGQEIASIVAVRGELAEWLEPLYPLADILEQVTVTSDSGTFHYLELLFDKANMAQLTGNGAVFTFLAKIFIDCFHVYLRPIRLWMDEGRLIPGDEIFFVSESRTQVPPGAMWQKQFKLRRSTDGALHAPKFLHPAATQIFNAGKNIVMLRRLGKFALGAGPRTKAEPALDFESMCPDGFALAPFSDLFDAAFDGWIQSKYRTTSTAIRDELLQGCGLTSALDDLQYLFLMSDGSMSDMFCEDLFLKIDSLDERWHSRYALNAVGIDVFSSKLDTTRLTIDAAAGDIDGNDLTIADSVRTALTRIQPHYRLPWPVQTVISPDSLCHYQSIFTFMLQVRRALYVLRQFKLLQHNDGDEDEWQETSLFYSSRRDLLWFCTTVQSYLSTLVLAPNLLQMRHDVTTAEDIDAMISVHTSCLKQVVDEACLGSRLAPIKECLLDVFDLAIKLEQARAANEAHHKVSAGRTTRRSQRHGHVEQSYGETLRQVKTDFERHRRFVVEGLRSVARASSDAQSVKWGMLAEMLQGGGEGQHEM